MKNYSKELIKDYTLAVLTVIVVGTPIFFIVKDYIKNTINPPVEVIDGCEYFYRWGDIRKTYTHKGNCSNPIHKNENK